MMTFVYILASLLLLQWVLMPLLRSSTAGSSGDALFHERTAALLHAVQELQAGDNEVAEEDRNNIRDRLILELAKIYHARGISPQQLLAKPGKAEKGTGTKAGKGRHSFCTGCGKPRENRYQFCPFCGNHFKAA